jgi:triacylglycerol lipase
VLAHDLFGFSLLADPAWADRVLTLTTIGTPHLGSAIADCARLRVGRVYRLLRTLGIEHRGCLDVTRRAARAVNRNGPTPRDVRCFSVAGDPLDRDVCWPLRPFFEHLSDLEGPNDGLVSVESAQGFGTPLPRWPVDHLRQMNWLAWPRENSSGVSILALYATVIENLAALGFAAQVPAAPQPSAGPRM